MLRTDEISHLIAGPADCSSICSRHRPDSIMPKKKFKEEKCQRNCLHKWLVHEITLPRFYCASKFFEPLLRLMKRIFHPPILSLRKVLDTPENARASSKHSYFNGFLSKSRQKIFLSPPHPPARPGRRLLMRVSRIAQALIAIPEKRALDGEINHRSKKGSGAVLV